MDIRDILKLQQQNIMYSSSHKLAKVDFTQIPNIHESKSIQFLNSNEILISTEKADLWSPFPSSKLF